MQKATFGPGTAAQREGERVMENQYIKCAG